MTITRAHGICPRCLYTTDVTSGGYIASHAVVMRGGETVGLWRGVGYGATGGVVIGCSGTGCRPRKNFPITRTGAQEHRPTKKGSP